MKVFRKIQYLGILYALIALVGVGACGESSVGGGTGSGSGSGSGSGGSGGDGYQIQYQEEILKLLLQEGDYYMNSFSALNNCSEYSSVVSEYKNQIKINCSGGGYKAYAPAPEPNLVYCDEETLLRYEPISVRVNYFDCQDVELGLKINGPFDMYAINDSSNLDFGETFTNIRIAIAGATAEEVESKNLDHLQLHVNDQIPLPGFDVIKANGKNQCSGEKYDEQLQFYTPTWVYDCTITSDCSTCIPE